MKVVEPILMVFLVVLAFASLFATAFADDGVNKLGSYSTTIVSVTTKDPVASATDVYESLGRNIVDRFWDSESNFWTNQCNGSSTPVLWPVAVIGKAVSNGMDNSTIYKAMDAISQYQSTQAAGYSATTARDGDIYTDDDAQAVWAFYKASVTTGNNSFFGVGNDLLDYIRSQEYNGTGILWSVKGNYLALISNVEAALAAVKSYHITPNQTYLQFAIHSLTWVFDSLMDSLNHFLYDGVDTYGNVNRGQLSYTVGAAISGFSFLSKFDSSKDWKSKALELAVRAIGAGNLNSIFYSDTYVHDDVKYSHLLFAGFADLVTETSPNGDYEQQAYSAIKAELVREARYLYDKYNAAIAASGGCSAAGQMNDLLHIASLLEIFYQASRVSGSF